MTSHYERLSRHPDLREPAFPAAEYARRRAIACAAMRERGIDLVVFNHLPSICYLSGYQTPATSDYNALYLSAAGQTALQIIEHEVPNAFLTASVDAVHAFSWYVPDAVPRQGAAIVAGFGLGDAFGLGVEMRRAALSVAACRDFERAFPRAALHDASDLLDAQRVIKSPAEIAFLREAGRLSVAGAEAALAAVRPGATDNDLAAAAMAAMLAGGSEYAATQPFIATGPRSGMVHSTFKRRPILPGDALFVETAASYQRYTAPVMRSGVFGPCPPALARLRDGVAETLALLLDAIRPGRTAHDVARDAARGFRGIRDEIFFQGAYGYHVGLSLPPAWWEGLDPYIAEGIEVELRPGMVFHLPVAARIPAVCGAALSETVLVTETGCEPLTATTRGFRDTP